MAAKGFIPHGVSRIRSRMTGARADRGVDIPARERRRIREDLVANFLSTGSRHRVRIYRIGDEIHRIAWLRLCGQSLCRAPRRAAVICQSLLPYLIGHGILDRSHFSRGHRQQTFGIHRSTRRRIAERSDPTKVY